MEECVFCRIVRKEIGDIIYETETHIVIADINPVSVGHLLVIPKCCADPLHMLSDEILRDGLVLIKKIVLALGLKRYNVIQNNGHLQSVYHVHYHIIPYNEEDEEGAQILFPISEKAQGSLAEVIGLYKKKLQDFDAKK